MDIMQAILRQMSPDRSEFWLRSLIDSLRPSHADDVEQAIKNLRALTLLLEQQPAYRAALRNALLALLYNKRQLPLYTEVGTLSNDGFFTSLFQRISERLLPQPRQPDSLKDAFAMLFHRADDYRWVATIPPGVWQEWWQSLNWSESDPQQARPTLLQLLEAVQVLVARIAATGVEPELVRAYPQVEEFESPFLQLGAECTRYVLRYRRALTEQHTPDYDHQHMLVLLEQCEYILAKVRKSTARIGISVSLTYNVLRLSLMMTRLKLLLTLLDPRHQPGREGTLFVLLAELVRAENRKYSLRDLFAANTELLALQVTEHAGRRGENYIADNRREWIGMAKSAMGAGVVVGFMALFKLQIAKLHLPLFWEALAFGLNYSFGFMLIHVLHFTIATKQPAMTAARIAAVIHTSGAKLQLDELTDLVVKVLRTQFIAILGNVLLALPTAWLISQTWPLLFGDPVAADAKAWKLLDDLHPLESPAVAHAAIAGVYLFLSGLIAGYYDNLAIYRRIPERLAALKWLRRLCGERRSQRLANYLGENLGGLAGNFYFGLFLGGTATVGLILGLPLDIRHITFAAANLTFAGSVLHDQLHTAIWLWSAAGVLLIGLTNLWVSFFLALWVALRSRKLSLSALRPLGGAVLRRFVRQPRSFFFPPREAQPNPNEVHD